MSISGISGLQAHNSYTAISTGSRINSAADDAAGLVISEQLESQANGYSVGTSNALAGQDLLKVADGALSTIQDSLQRIRDLSIQASNNAVYSSSDIEAMQYEIDGLKQSIQDTAKNTSFNTRKLLDGSMADLNLATNPQGGGMQIQLVNSTLESLGIEDYNVTGDFNIKDIDDAIQKVSDARSNIGARSNAIDHTVSYNRGATYNLTKSKSSLADADYAEEMMKISKEKALEQYRLFGQKAHDRNKSLVLRLMGM